MVKLSMHIHLTHDDCLALHDHGARRFKEVLDPMQNYAIDIYATCLMYTSLLSSIQQRYTLADTQPEHVMVDVSFNDVQRLHQEMVIIRKNPSWYNDDILNFAIGFCESYGAYVE